MGRSRSGKERTILSRLAAAAQWFVLTVCLLLATGTLLVGLRLRTVTQGLPGPAEFERGVGGGETVILAADRDPSTNTNYVLGRVSDRYQEAVPYDRIPAALLKATVAIEDERFYEHPGIDVWGIVRALVRNVQEKRLSEGASTLTQQLVKNIFLTRRKTLDRKLQEAILALQMERTFTKERILERYVNEVNYGGNIYGVGAAAHHYFRKRIEELNVSECALLAGLPREPARTDPFRHPAAALRRRDVVLAKMRELGYLTAEEAADARARSIRFQPKPPPVSARFLAPHFTNWVLRGLIKRLGKDAVYRGGLTVYTTLHWEMQRIAESKLRDGVREGRDSGVTEGALVCMEPTSGAIRAMVGSVDPERTKYNYATGRSQPGSTFKPFVYAAAFESGRYTPDSSVYDGPVRFGDWSPRNYGGKYSYSSLSIRSAVALSKNTVPVRIANEIGAGKVVELAHRLGVVSELNRDLTLALGTCQVSPLEMTTAYCAFANGGNRVEPIAVSKVLDRDGLVVENTDPRLRSGVLTGNTVRRIDECLEAVVDYGTAAGASEVHEVEGARGKTGTTSDNKDAWFIGYTPELTTTVYVNGVRNTVRGGKSINRYVPMQGVTGGHVCAPIWGRFMKDAVALAKRVRSGDPFTGILVRVSYPGSEAAPAPPAAPARPSATPPTGPDAIGGAVGPDSVGISDPVPATSENLPEPGDLSAEPPIPARPPTSSATVGTQRSQGGGAGSAPGAGTEPATVARPAPPPDPMVAILVCADSGAIANDYCPEALRRRVPASKVPRRKCREHGPRPDER
ncbi:MAG: transglycosylase domain-containing protein [Armatimonadota bacterium]